MESFRTGLLDFLEGAWEGNELENRARLARALIKLYQKNRGGKMTAPKPFGDWERSGYEQFPMDICIYLPHDNSSIGSVLRKYGRRLDSMSAERVARCEFRIKKESVAEEYGGGPTTITVTRRVRIGVYERGGSNKTHRESSQVDGPSVAPSIRHQRLPARIELKEHTGLGKRLAKAAAVMALASGTMWFGYMNGLPPPQRFIFPEQKADISYFSDECRKNHVDGFMNVLYCAEEKTREAMIRRAR
jgi:hypothetical protein